MKKFEYVEVSEKELEDLIRQAPDVVEDGLQYIDHQKRTNRGPLDVLMVDSGGSLVVAELKVVEDDTMLVQGIDYYDYISMNVEGQAGAYSNKFDINPEQDVRLFLIAPGFSVSLLNRCKWIKIPISLFGYKCIQCEGSEEKALVCWEVTTPSVPIIERVYMLEDKFEYIRSTDARKRAENLLEEIRSWDERNISADAIQAAISLRFSGTVFCYLSPCRNFFNIQTYNQDNKWTSFPIHNEEDVESVKVLLKTNIEKLK